MRAAGAIVALALAVFAAAAALQPSSVTGATLHAVLPFLAALASLGAGAMAVVAIPGVSPELAALRRGLELLHGFDAAVLILADADGRILFVNDVASGVYGRPRLELLSMRLPDLRHPTAPPTAGERLAGEPDAARLSFASVHERADGSPFFVEVSSRKLVLDGREHSFTVIHDVTEERLTQAAMTEGAELHRTVSHTIPMIQFSVDADGRFTLLEGRGLDVLGLKPGELAGRSIFEVAKDLPELVAAYLRALRGERFSGVTRIARYSFDVHWAPLLREDGSIRGVTGVGLDVTDRFRAERARKATEARLVVAERLASMGRLAAGVAHEINNPLAWVMSNLGVAIERLKAGAVDRELPELLEEARVGTERVRDIVRDLRVFARSDGVRGSGCDVAAVAHASLAMARNELRHRARVETRFEPVPPAAIPERQLGQILVNLLVNAAQAIREGSAADNLVTVSVRPDAEAVLIEVRDTGAGMTPEVRDRVFEPFFTTKDGEGMGLGLALCQTMVQEAGGRIDVASEPGAGSTFRVRLPRADGVPTPPPGSAAARAGAAPADDPVRRGRLLLVDDEPLVGRSVARALPEHDVEFVTDAHEALDRIHRGARYDVLICDLMMPEMTGMDLAQRLTDEHHELSRRMVFLTGGAFTERARAFLALTRAPVVEKPFERHQLAECVASVLRAARS